MRQATSCGHLTTFVTFSCRPGERKHKSDTDGRWAHDKFAALELGQDIDNTSESAFVRIMLVACKHSVGGAGCPDQGVGGGAVDLALHLRSAGLLPLPFRV